MTLEQRFVAGLGDIRAVTMQCQCGARLTLAPDKINEGSYRQCPSCLVIWLAGSENADLLRFLILLKQAAQAQRESAAKLRVLFEFDEPSKSGSSLASAP